MNLYLIVAAVLTVLIGVLHSFLGERYILTRLFRRDNIPRLFGSDVFTKRTLRFAWHLTTLAWWGFAVQLFRFAQVDTLSGAARSAAVVVAWMFLIRAIVSFVAGRGGHFSWFVFLGIAVAIWLGL